MSHDIHREKILILDFGSQYTQLIARRVRECQVYCEIHPWDMPIGKIRDFNPQGVILSGGHQSVYDLEAPTADGEVLKLAVPILGICYGMQWLSLQLNGGVAASQRREYGPAKIHREGNASPLFAGFLGQEQTSVWMSHGDHVDRLPTGFQVAARSENGMIAAIVNEEHHQYGVQFHPEVNHTPRGDLIIQNFTRHICHCSGSWTPANVITHAVERIRQLTGEDEVILGLSGGVDSSVVAALIHQAIGPRLTCVFVDNGLLRLHEGDQVMATFAEHMGVKVIRVDAGERFLGKLAGVSDPEQKRRIIGHTFIEIFEEEAKRLPNARWLAQGTIYPDVIESAGAHTKTAANIKSHHNVGGLPERMGLKLLEPLRELFKDEVRLAGLELGLPRSMIFRHPFPGPGLGVRILGAISQDKADILRFADAIFIEELHNAELYDHIGQAFAVFLPVKSVGVMGDGRTYEYVIALRAVETKDFMTASFYPLPHELLGRVANRIVNEVKGVNRVVFDVTSKPPGTIEWE